MSVVNELKHKFKSSDIVMQLIFINIAVFLLYHIIHLCLTLFKAEHFFDLTSWLAVPSDLGRLLTHPWTLITYMFFHIEILHILFNMLWLYWFGQIFRRFFNRQLTINLYLLGGLVGALFYIAAYNIFPVFETQKEMGLALGASAAVLAIVVAVAFYAPNYTLNLLFFGQVKLIYIAVFTIILDIISISVSNAGGHIAHLGGACFGIIFANNIKKGKDITSWLTRFFRRIKAWFTPKPKMKVHYAKTSADDQEYNRQKFENQQEIDRILDKISKGGYESLTKEEKETLFKQKG